MRAMLAGASVAVLTLFGGAQVVSAETLTQALASAYRYNPCIDPQRAALRATDEGVAVANSG